MYVTGIPNIRDVIAFPPHLRRFLMGAVRRTADPMV